MTRTEGVLVGGSCGTAMWAAIELAKELGPDDLVVVILPDSGKSYLSKLYNEAWMAEYGFIDRPTSKAKIAQVLGEKRRVEAGIPDIVAVPKTEKVGRAIDMLQEFGISQLLVGESSSVDDLSQIIGQVNERDLLDQVFKDPSAIDADVSTLMGDPLPVVQSVAGIDELFAALSKGAEALVVADGNHPTGVLTRADLLEFLAHQQRS